MAERPQLLVVLVGVIKDRAVADRLALFRIVAGDTMPSADALRQLSTAA